MQGRTLLLGLDFDGTLADSKKAVESSLYWVASQDSDNSINRLEQNLHSITGLSLEKQLLSFLNLLSIDRAKLLFMEFYKTKGFTETLFNEGAEKLIRYCQLNQIELVVISAKTKVNLDLSMEFLGIPDIPRFGGCNLDDKTSIMKQLGVDFYVGDQRSDIQAALNAKVISIYLGISVWKDLQPNYRIQKLDQIIPILEKFDK